MSRKPVPAQSGDKSRVEMTFDSPRALSRLFGEFDQNLVTLENRLGVYITARGDRIGLEGRADEVAVARDVLNGLYNRVMRGEHIDPGLVDAEIAMTAEPTLDGIVRREATEPRVAANEPRLDLVGGPGRQPGESGVPLVAEQDVPRSLAVQLHERLRLHGHVPV